MNKTTNALLVVTAALAIGCEAEDADGPDTPTPTQTASATSGTAADDDARPVLESVSRVEREMSLWADAPAELAEGSDRVVLEYENFPGYYEIFDSSVVKDCILAREDEPFKVVFFRYLYAGGNTIERVTAIEACPTVSSEEMAAEWLEAELLRASIATPDQADPASNVAGWSGRGFYKFEGAEAQPSPLEGNWSTFCGEKTGTVCSDVLVVK